MSQHMTLEQKITHAAARAAVAWSNNEDEQAAEWHARAVALMDVRDEIDKVRDQMRQNCAPVSFYARPAS